MWFFRRKKSKPSEYEARATFNRTIANAIKTATDHGVPRQRIADALIGYGAEVEAPIHRAREKLQSPMGSMGR
jgi:hypothetical protein